MSELSGTVELMLSDATGGDYVRWAERALAEGFDTPSLRILAGLPRTANRSETELYFRHTLDELHIQLPRTDEGLRRAFLQRVAVEVVARRISPSIALERIHSQILMPLGHPPDLRHWCFLWEGLHPTTYRDLSVDERDELVLRAAAEIAQQK